jgi:WD40 repeat protein
MATRQPIGPGAPGRPFKGKAPQSALGFSRDGQILFLETRDGFVFWSIAKRGPAGPPVKNVEHGVSFSPDGRLVAVGTKDGVILWDPVKGEPTGPPLKPPDSLKGRAVPLVFSPDGRILAAVSSGEVILWDVANREVTGLLNRSGGGISKALWGAISQVVFSPDGRVLAWLSNRGREQNSGEIFLWDVAKRGLIVPPLSGHPAVRTVEFSPDGKIASGGHDFSVALWDPSTGRTIGDRLSIGDDTRLTFRDRLQDPGVAGVGKLAFSPNGETLVAASRQPTVLELWDVAHQPPRLLRRFTHLGGLRVVRGPGHFTPIFGSVGSPSSLFVSAFERSPDGKVLAFRTNGQLALWDLASRESVDKPAIVPGFEGETIAFSPDSTTLATYQDSKEGTVISLWDVATLMSPGHGR